MGTQFFDLVITGGKVFLSQGKAPPYVHSLQELDLGISSGIVQSIAPNLKGKGRSEIDAQGLVVLPGVIDSQVHFREPGHTHKEDLESGSQAAVLGGVTSFLDMPNTQPNTVTAESLKEKVKAATGRSWANFGFFIGACEENIDELKTLETLPHCAGVKIFMGSSTGSLLMAEDSSLTRALASGRRSVAIHSEDESLLEANAKKLFTEDKAYSPSLHPQWRSEQVALSSTKRIVQIARAQKRRIHILHMTTQEELEFLKDKKDICTIEVTPQHLTLAAPECYQELGTLAQMNPPIREARHREALWKALNSGLIDVIGSDHAPHTLEEKSRPYPQSPSGMPGVQTLLPLMLDHVHNQRTSLERIVEMCCLEPARVYGLSTKGRIAEGKCADLTLVDLNKTWTVHNKDMATRSGWTPFDGKKLTGSPEVTIVQGVPVTRDRALLSPPETPGKALIFDF